MLEEEWAMFTGDNVLGTGSGVFRSLPEYIKSLELMRDMHPTTLYPGHGPIVTRQASSHIQNYIDHRMERVEQVRQCLESLECATLQAITDHVYKGLEKKYRRGAMSNCLHALEYLVTKSIAVKRHGDVWSLTHEPCL